MNGILIVFGILSVYIFAALIMDKISGSVPPPFPWWTNNDQNILNLQRIALVLSALIFALLYFIQPEIRIVWILGTIGIFYAGISSIFREISAVKIKIIVRLGVRGQPATGIHAIAAGSILIGIALFISFVILFNPDWWSIPLERPLPNAQSIYPFYFLL